VAAFTWSSVAGRDRQREQGVAHDGVVRDLAGGHQHGRDARAARALDV
jgi:hypothetical protein